MIDKPRDKIIYKWLHHCYHWTVLDIFTNCRSTRCEKKKRTKNSKIFFSLYASCQMRKTNCPLNNNPRCFMYTVCTKKYVPNFQENYEKIQKWFNDSMNRLLKREKKKHSSLHFSSSSFFNITRARARGDEGVANQIRSTQRGNRNNSMTEGDAGNQTRSSSPSFNEFHALLCPYSFARARVHAYPTRSSR